MKETLIEITNQVTLEKVIELSEKGTELNWEDFKTFVEQHIKGD